MNRSCIFCGSQIPDTESCYRANSGVRSCNGCAPYPLLGRRIDSSAETKVQVGLSALRRAQLEGSII